MTDLKTQLLSKSWFGFDLDDTLHEFRKASRTATEAALARIATSHNILLQDLKSAYKKVLQQGTWNSFTDGRTSDQYRKERFASLMRRFDLTPTDEFLRNLAVVYKDALGKALERKTGARELLVILRERGKKVAVITEGPQDAQEWTLEKLGLAEHMDFLATSNKYGISKTTGLFTEVLKELKIKGEEMVFVGDSYERDVVPAIAEGILAIHYQENGRSSLNCKPFRIKSLETLEDLLGEGGEELELGLV